MRKDFCTSIARLAQSAERTALNLVVVGSSPTVGILFDFQINRFGWAQDIAPSEARTPDLEVHGLTL